jgi:hypothetical protein
MAFDIQKRKLACRALYVSFCVIFCLLLNGLGKTDLLTAFTEMDGIDFLDLIEF